MNAVNRFNYFLKVASYNVPDQDMYAPQPTQPFAGQVFNKKNMATLGAGAVGAKAMHSLSKPFADSKVPLGSQKFRNIATLGAGLFAAKKARDFMSRRQQSGSM